MLIDLDEIKSHLRIDGDEDNDLLSQYLLACIDDIELRTHRPLISATDPDAICTSEENVPSIIKQYILVSIGDMYRNRENGQEKSLSTYFNHLLDAYIRYDR